MTLNKKFLWIPILWQLQYFGKMLFALIQQMLFTIKTIESIFQNITCLYTKKDLSKLFDKQSEMDLLTYSTQEKMINLIRTLANKESYGTLLTEEDNTALLHSIVTSWLPTLNDNPIPTIIREFEGKYLVSYVINSIGELYGRDILELINFNYSLATCPI